MGLAPAAVVMKRFRENCCCSTEFLESERMLALRETMSDALADIGEPP